MSNTIGFQNTFSIPIFTAFIDKEIANSIENLTIPKLNQLEFKENVYTDYYNKERIFDLGEISKLIEQLNFFINNFSVNTGIKIKNKIDYWVQDYKPSNYHLPHAHPNSSISGIYYIRANDYAGPVEFINPNPYEYFSTNDNLIDKLSYKIYPKKGLLILFPSYLFHTVIPSNHKDIIRTSLAFNIVK